MPTPTLGPFLQAYGLNKEVSAIFHKMYANHYLELVDISTYFYNHSSHSCSNCELCCRLVSFCSFRYPNLLNSDCEDALLEYLAAPDQNTKSRHLLIPSSDCLPLFQFFIFFGNPRMRNELLTAVC